VDPGRKERERREADLSLLERATDKLRSERQEEATAPRNRNEQSAPQRAALDVDGGPRQEHEGAVAEDARAAAADGQSVLQIDRQRLNALGYIDPADRDSSLGRQFRRVKRPLLLRMHDTSLGADALERSNLIAVTSAQPREGKTYVSVNLAFSIVAELDRTVLLVNADPVQRAAERLLQAPGSPGLTDVLDGSAALEDAIWETSVPSLQFMAAGSHTDAMDELLASASAVEVFERLSAEEPNRVVLIDTAPVLACTEPAVLARQTGQVLFVIEARQTPRAVVQEALSALADHPGVVTLLNKSTDRLNLFNRDYGYYYASGHPNGQSSGASRGATEAERGE